ncbi:WXG100 family type VII secretion target [Micromonospora sp. WMMD882]|uniref:WXG100 family type VII secretion target n=1 Tax=Micromonospora sp. WMMD882 TaxID=3015151 RepID=UPI00248AC2F6|nr:DUF6883 domain-containing protein [Micromonospora sp. WMMD882]WBB82216.1 WXG100 family type VII secretion target [Micromonospora sp. WMMD882]
MTVPESLVAARVDSTTAWSGIGLAEDVDALVAAFRSGSWIDGTIGGFAAGMDALATVVDPLGQLVSWGVAWLVEHVKPLSDALDQLAGDPDQITAYAATWTNVASALRVSAEDLTTAVRADLAGWRSAAADAYREQAGRQQRTLTTLGNGAEALATVTTGTGLVVALVRELVRDLIADFVSVLAVRLWEWLAIAGGTLGAGIPWVVAQVSSLAARWAAKIARLLTALITSLRRLAPLLTRLDDLLHTLHTRPPHPTPADRPGPVPEPASQEPRDGPTGSDITPTPDFSAPTIDSRKITQYAMNPDHPVGRNKYRVINAATGLGPQDAALIEEQIASGVRHGDPIPGRADEYGRRWSVDVELAGPTGNITVRTAWITDADGVNPRLTTISFPPRKD